jgi:SAM-dependent methyltransferase
MEHENSLDNAGYVKMFREKIDVVRKICPQAQSILDYGCGYEPVLKTLLEKENYRVTVFDSHFFPEEPKNIPFDLVISTETFEHFKNPADELNKIFSLLGPPGFLAVMTRYYPTEKGQARPELFEKWFYKRDPTHICFYCRETFEWIAREKNCRIAFDNNYDFAILQLASS